MAIEKVIAKRTLNLYVVNGTNADGSEKLKAHSFAKVKDSASNEDVYAVATAIGGLMETPVVEIGITEKSTLTEVL